jgi:glycosyltransferase involved in cell wall biosynthesis
VPVVNTLHDLWLLCPNNMLLRQDLTQCDPYSNHAACYRRYDFWGNVPRRRSVFAALTANVKVFISPSQAVIERHVEAGYARERFKLVRLGFEQAPIPEVTQPALQRVMADAPGQHLVTYAGGGVEIKGARVLAKAIPLMLSQDPHLHVVIAGGGEPALLDEFRTIDPRVTVLGWVPFGEMLALYAASDLTLSPSIWHENSSVVILQSHQMGTPVAASRIGGNPELVAADETGYLFAPGDPEALAQQVARHFAKAPHERRAMRRACVESVRAQWSLEQHLDQHVAIYQQVIG